LNADLIEAPGLREQRVEKRDNAAVTLMMPNNQITLLQNGEAYFPALEAALDLATHEIYLETYIFEDDATGRRIAEALRRAALRGVKTHLLVDGFGSFSLPETMVDFLEAAGVLVLKFRPKTSPWTLRRRRLRRLHRKIVVVDRTIAFVGGMNIIDHFSLLLSMEANIVVDDGSFALELKHSLEQAIKMDARQIIENSWRTKSTKLRLVNWLSYGVVRFMIGIAGYAPGIKSGQAKRR
jgi:hypothetical protein